LETYPSSINTIPSRVFFTVDTRHPDQEKLMQFNEDLKNLVNTVCSSEGLENEFSIVQINPSVEFHQDCINIVRNSAQSLGYSHRDIVSGAGHDACYLNDVAPTGMIFIPCDNGLSHDEAENTSPEQVAAGADVLLNSVLASAGS
jgi:N-carbamoyl-L-amino-acid hydrolase